MLWGQISMVWGVVGEDWLGLVVGVWLWCVQLVWGEFIGVPLLLGPGVEWVEEAKVGC